MVKTEKHPNARAQDLVTQLSLMKHEFGRLEMFRSVQAIDKALITVGFELAARITKDSSGERAGKRADLAEQKYLKARDSGSRKRRPKVDPFLAGITEKLK